MPEKFVAYYRVSTKRQGLSGLGLDAQREAVRRFVADGQLVAEYEEIESGKRADRPALEGALRECRLSGATLLIAKLDRLSRSVAFLSRLMEDGTEFRAVDMPQANRFMIHIMAAMAEQEREMIAQRTRAALSAARERGVKLGGRRGTHRIELYGEEGRKRSANIRSTQASRRAQEIAQVIADLNAAGVTTQSGIAKALNERAIAAPRGGAWSAGQVRRIALRTTAL
ncbi:MAG: recombinase family protein [Phenylobacterium sp.]|uniref:recombinase family protein n=1 Tax=Phenylobacterium sp. TaxID=1871053 RepID=UPI002736C5E5|nr:recombinase family protein [Phenylobacterium sp.]MDP3745613.1 recombinase family protein [Phenylobacterium sp.]